MIISSSSSIIDCSPLTKTQGTSDPHSCPARNRGVSWGTERPHPVPGWWWRGSRTPTQGVGLQSLLRPRAKALLFGRQYCEGKENRSIFIFQILYSFSHLRGWNRLWVPGTQAPASCFLVPTLWPSTSLVSPSPRTLLRISQRWTQIRCTKYTLLSIFCSST